MRRLFASLLIFVLAFGAYLATACPTITWWDNAEYITCAHTLGITHPPGSVFLVLVGRLFARFAPISDPAFRINLMIVLFAGVTVCLVYRTGVLLLRKWGPPNLVHASAIVGALTLAFTHSVWQHAAKVTPYGLSLFFSALIIWVSLKWWDRADEPCGDRWLVFIVFLLGMDSGIHRNNVLLIPALFLMVLLRKPHVLANWRLWGAVPIVAFLGFSMHTVLLIRSGLNPPMDATDPETVGRLLDWLTLKGVGGSLLPNIFERKAPLWSYQIREMYVRYLNWNFIGRGGAAGVLTLKGLFGIPALVGCVGLFYHFFKDWKGALYLFAAFLMTGLGAVLYLNVPPAYFREIDRHFLASFLVFGLWIGIGVYALLQGVRALVRHSEKGTLPGTLLLAVLLPINMFRTNLHENNRSGDYFTYDFAYNLLETCDPDAILFTNGDSDTFPLWYLQIVEGVRRDVAVVNIPLLGAPWYRIQIRQQDPEFPVSLSPSEWENIRLTEWEKQAVTIEVPEDVLRAFDPEMAARQDTTREQRPHLMSFTVEPTFEGTHLLPSQRVVLDIVTTNRWERPIYFANTVAEGNCVGLGPFLRLDGLARQVTPTENPSPVPDMLERNLLIVYTFRSTHDPNLFVDGTSGALLSNYKSIFFQLAQFYAQENRVNDCLRVLHRMEELFPEKRFPDPSPQFTAAVESMYQRFGESRKW